MTNPIADAIDTIVDRQLERYGWLIRAAGESNKPPASLKRETGSKR